MFKETFARSVLKATSYRLLGTLQTTVIVYFVSGDMKLSMMAGTADLFGKIILYSLHERVWNKITYGKRRIVPRVIWLCGLSGAGKTTIAEKVVAQLRAKNLPVEYLDGDTIRALFPATGFSKEERIEHIKRVGLLASSLEKNNVFVVVALITPFEEARKFVKKLCKNFILTYVKAPLEICEKRDVKGLYKKARAGEIKNFTGIDSPFEEPLEADLVLDTSELDLTMCTNLVLKKIGKI
jgi:adenylylsulfate kinase